MVVHVGLKKKKKREDSRKTSKYISESVKSDVTYT